MERVTFAESWEEFFGEFGLESFGERNTLSPAMDVAETDSQLQATMELPGIEKDDIEIKRTSVRAVHANGRHARCRPFSRVPSMFGT